MSQREEGVCAVIVGRRPVRMSHASFTTENQHPVFIFRFPVDMPRRRPAVYGRHKSRNSCKISLCAVGMTPMKSDGTPTQAFTGYLQRVVRRSSGGRCHENSEQSEERGGVPAQRSYPGRRVAEVLAAAFVDITMQAF